MPPLPHPTPSTAASTLPLLIRRASSSLSHTKHTLLSLLHRRQTTTIIPADYTNINSSLSPGAVIGIVLGSVGGFLLILWLIYTLMGGNIAVGASSDVSSIVIRERKRSRRGSSRRTSSRRESVEVREVRRPPAVERVVVEERRESRPGPPPAVVVEVESSSLGSEDEVVVIEEHSPPPRRASGSKKAKESGYRPVDPMAYGGGDEPLRGVDRRGSRRSNR
jgi:hypothetical protein